MPAVFSVVSSTTANIKLDKIVIAPSQPRFVAIHVDFTSVRFIPEIKRDRVLCIVDFKRVWILFALQSQPADMTYLRSCTVDLLCSRGASQLTSSLQWIAVHKTSIESQVRR